MDEACIMDEQIETVSSFPASIPLVLSNFRNICEANCEDIDDFIDQNENNLNICERTFTILADVENEQEEIIGEIRANIISIFKINDENRATPYRNQRTTIHGEERQPLTPTSSMDEQLAVLLEDDFKWGDIYITIKTTQTIEDVTYYAEQDYEYSIDDYINTISYTMENVSYGDRMSISNFFSNLRKPYSLFEINSGDSFPNILFILLGVVVLGFLAFFIVRVYKNYDVVTERWENPVTGKVKNKRSLRRKRR